MPGPRAAVSRSSCGPGVAAPRFSRFARARAGGKGAVPSHCRPRGPGEEMCPQGFSPEQVRFQVRALEHRLRTGRLSAGLP